LMIIVRKKTQAKMKEKKQRLPKKAL